MAHIVKKSPWPVYAVGLVWLVFGLFLPLYKLIHFLAAAGLSIAAYLVVKKLCPDKTFTVPDPEPEPEPDPKPEQPTNPGTTDPGTNNPGGTTDPGTTDPGTTDPGNQGGDTGTTTPSTN